jgi:hypothetical protein
MLQLAQTPLAPHALSLVPALHKPPAQQPTLHKRLRLQVVAQACVVVLHACPDGQSLAVLQPQPVPPMQRWPIGLALQSTHEPLVPQLVVDGTWHVGFTKLAGQQLPVQATRLQLVSQRLVPALHDEPTGHSPGLPGLLQPQNLPDWHRWPVDTVEQSRQAPPSAPHLASAVPAMQVPLSQQPFLHGEVALHVVVQLCVMTLQARWSPQSAAESQPHLLVPPGMNTQVVPFMLPAQLVHVAVPTSHASAAKPARQVPLIGSQQPLLQSLWPAPHAASHTCDVVLHDVPNGQSAATVQPQLPMLQLLPSLARVQSMQPAPDVAHASPATAAQTLLAPQQKPAPQMLPLPTLHDATHVPPEHTGVAPLQATHAMPL